MERPWTGHCQRCGQKSLGYSMSFFNEDLICFDCIDKERRHPEYAAAHAAEKAAVLRGDYNFPGVGKPLDL